MPWTKVPKSKINPPYRGFNSYKYGDGRKPPSGGGGGGTGNKGCKLFVLAGLGLASLTATGVGAALWAAIERL